LSLREQIAWWWFYLPRGGVQAVARRVPLDRLRELLPRQLSSRLRVALAPARIGDATSPSCARVHPAWGEPAGLDPTRPIAVTTPRVSILIVTWNNLALTRLCLASLQRFAPRAPFEIVVVDNASTDGTPQWLREAEASRLLPLTVVQNATNRGFAPASNQAAARARGDYLVFLNNDTVVTPGWLDGLLAHLEGDPSIGLIGPRTNSCGNEAELGTPYRDLDEMLQFAAERVQRRELSDTAMLALYCAVMPRSLFRELGGLDERYRVGMFEDDDLAMAVRRVGRRVVLAHDVFVHHYGGAAFTSLPPAHYLRVWWENRRRFEAKWGVGWQKR
jgi:GT2 family glycosyltransferase